MRIVHNDVINTFLQYVRTLLYLRILTIYIFTENDAIKQFSWL